MWCKARKNFTLILPDYDFYFAQFANRNLFPRETTVLLILIPSKNSSRQDEPIKIQICRSTIVRLLIFQSPPGIRKLTNSDSKALFILETGFHSAIPQNVVPCYKKGPDRRRQTSNHHSKLYYWNYITGITILRFRMCYRDLVGSCPKIRTINSYFTSDVWVLEHR